MLEAMEDDSPPLQKPYETRDATEPNDADVKELLKQPLRRLLPRKERQDNSVGIVCGSSNETNLDSGHQSETSPLLLKGSLKRLIPRKSNTPKDCDPLDNVNLSGELDRSPSSSTNSTPLVRGTLKRLLQRKSKVPQDTGEKKQHETADLQPQEEDNNQNENSETNEDSSDSEYDSSEEKKTKHSHKNSPYKTKRNTKKLKYDHPSMHTGPRKCDICKRIFASEQSRRSHVRRYHSGRVYVPIPCEYCDKEFQFQSASKLQVADKGNEKDVQPAKECQQKNSEHQTMPPSATPDTERIEGAPYSHQESCTTEKLFIKVEPQECIVENRESWESIPGPSSAANFTDAGSHYDNSVEYSEMCAKFPAVLSDSQQEPDVMVPLFSGYRTMIDRNQINRCIINCKGDPARLQRLLLIAIKGKPYIAMHSAGGQRARGSDDQPPKGHPAADEDLLSAVELFVKFKFSETGDIVVPSIVETYNRLAGNLRSAEARKMGKYQYPKKPRAKKRKQN